MLKLFPVTVQVCRMSRIEADRLTGQSRQVCGITLGLAQPIFLYICCHPLLFFTLMSVACCVQMVLVVMHAFYGFSCSKWMMTLSGRTEKRIISMTLPLTAKW